MTAASAQLASVPEAGIELSKLEMLRSTAHGLSIETVASGQAGVFVPQTSLRIKNDAWHRTIWLRLEIKAGAQVPQSAEQAVLFLPKPYIDTVRFFTPADGAAGAWTAQNAGDHLAPSSWPIRSLHPQFLLPSAAQVRSSSDQRMVLYVEIDQNVPGTYDLHMESAKAALDIDLLALLIYGICFGTILLAAIITLGMALFYRDQIYAWYSAYAMFALLSCMSHSGVAHHVLWPVNGDWAGTAVMFFALLCSASQLQFCRAVVIPAQLKGALSWLTHLISASCVLLAVLYALLPEHWKTFFFCTLALMASTMVLTALLMLLGWRARNPLAKVWFLAFFPLFTTVVFSFLVGIGEFTTGYGAHAAVIYSVTVEVLILGLALQWFARARHGERERRRVLSDLDPLTGFVTANAFKEQLQRDWHSQAARKLDHAVVYIELRTQASNAAQMEDLLKRSVRIMRSATHVSDVVLRLDGSLMAISMPHVQMGDDLSQRLSRIVALGLMPNRSDPQAQVLQFRIAATTHQHFKAPFVQLDTQLRELLAQNVGWGSKPIRFIDGISSIASPRSLLTEPDLDDVWERAFDQEQKDERASGKL